MELMQQSANHLDGRWRSHMHPYSGHSLSSIPNLHDHIRQQMISQQQSQQHLPIQHISNDHHQQLHQQQMSSTSHSDEQQQHHMHQQIQQQRQIIMQHRHRRGLTPSPSKELIQQSIANNNNNNDNRVGVSSGLPSPSLQLNSLSLQSSPSSASPSTPTSSPPTPSPGKSGSGKEGEEKKGEEWKQYNAGAAFLGPTLWDKTLSYDSDLKVSLEYMDLDEFLNENGIPLDDAKRNAASNAPGDSGSSNLAGLPPTSTSSNSMRASAHSPEAPSSPENSPQMENGMGACPSARMASAVAAAGGGGISVVPPAALSPQEYGGDCSSSVSSPGSPDPLSPLQVHEPVPGQDFDPRTRCFSEEELKPQPMIKKSRKQFVPAEMKDEKYWARRRKNNMAAKRSRDARRLKENQIAMRANFLEKENNAMTVELQKAQAIVESLKKRLAMYEAV